MSQVPVLEQKPDFRKVLNEYTETKAHEPCRLDCLKHINCNFPDCQKNPGDQR